MKLFNRFGVDSDALLYLTNTLYQMDVSSLVSLCAMFPNVHLFTAVSRAIVGRELFWYPLFEEAKRFFHTNFDMFKLSLSSDDLQTLANDYMNYYLSYREFFSIHLIVWISLIFCFIV